MCVCTCMNVCMHVCLSVCLYQSTFSVWCVYVVLYGYHPIYVYVPIYFCLPSDLSHVHVSVNIFICPYFIHPSIHPCHKYVHPWRKSSVHPSTLHFMNVWGWSTRHLTMNGPSVRTWIHPFNYPTYTRKYIHIYIPTYIRTHIPTYIHTRMYVCGYLHMDMCTYRCIHISLSMWPSSMSCVPVDPLLFHVMLSHRFRFVMDGWMDSCVSVPTCPFAYLWVYICINGMVCPYTYVFHAYLYLYLCLCPCI